MDNEGVLQIVLLLFAFLVLAFFETKKWAKRKKHGWKYNPDQYHSLPEITDALRRSGLECCNLIVAIDFTKSNLEQGQRTNNGQSLHFLSHDGMIQNPYEQAIRICGRTLEDLDEDNYIPVYGFGAMGEGPGKHCFPLHDNPKGCYGFNKVLDQYRRKREQIVLSGPTNFAHVIHKAVDICVQKQEFHVLIILCDGQVTSKRDTIDAIVKASNYPLAIVIVGIGDGPWDDMTMYDDGLPERKFDNVQFVPFHDTTGGKEDEQSQVKFAIAALQELPDQYKACKQLDLL